MAQNSGTIQVRSLKNQALIADKCLVADSFFSRFKGLLGQSVSLETGEGLLLRPCSDIHMWFMRIAIDVVFVSVRRNDDGTQSRFVASVHENVRPWRPLPLRDGKASETLELPVGTIRRCALSAGDELCLS